MTRWRSWEKKPAPDVGMRIRDEATAPALASRLPLSLPPADGNAGPLLHSAATWNANEGGRCRLLMRADPGDKEREIEKENEGGEVNKLKKKRERSELRIRRSSRNSDVPN